MSTENKQKKSWKDHLLRSGVPLEFDVAKILVSEGMVVSSDHSFYRKEGSSFKEWSTDISSNWYSCPSDNEIDFMASLLIECKYRSPEKTILLLPDPNNEISLSTLGSTLCSFDEHVPFRFKQEELYKFERKFPTAYKAIEIHESGAVEEDLRHGFQQLRYGSTSIIREDLHQNVMGHFEENFGLFFCRVLVTNAPIRILNEKVGIDEIRKSNSLNSLSKPISRAVFVSETGPDFEEHVLTEFSKDSGDFLEAAKRCSTRLRIEGKNERFGSDITRLAEGLIAGERWIVRAYFNQHFIVNLDGLPQFLRDLKLATNRSFKNRKKFKIPARAK